MDDIDETQKLIFVGTMSGDPASRYTLSDFCAVGE
jgi:hypothetical protein